MRDNCRQRGKEEGTEVTKSGRKGPSPGPDARTMAARLRPWTTRYPAGPLKKASIRWLLFQEDAVARLVCAYNPLSAGTLAWRPGLVNPVARCITRDDGTRRGT